MFHRIDKKYEIELPLTTLFEAPTIARCAGILRARLAETSEKPRNSIAHVTATDEEPLRPFSALVTIQPGEGPISFFCVHGAGGNVLNFRDLARAMDQAQPFYGLQAYGVDGVTPPHETIEDMAAAYLTEVREVQAEGPYLLGGYSGGGLVAFEMAQLLAAAGHEVRLLALIDTFHPQMSPRRMTMRGRIARLREEKLGYVSELMVRPRDRVRHLINLRSIEAHRIRGEAVPFALRNFHMTRNFEMAAARYRPRTWAGPATLFRAAELAYIYRDAGPYYGWDRHVLGGMEVVPVAGNHSTIVLGRNGDVLARSLSAAIARARQPLDAIRPSKTIVTAAGEARPNALPQPHSERFVQDASTLPQVREAHSAGHQSSTAGE
jgi:thioesterase domain-containing protein